MTGYGEDFEDTIGPGPEYARLRDPVEATRFLLARRRPQWDTTAMDVTARMATLVALLHGEEARALRPMDLTRQQFEVLLLLAQRPATRPTWVGTLARESGVSSAAMTQRLQRLEDGGLVERHREPPDTRHVMVLLTDHGRDTVDLSAELVLAARTRHLEGLSQSEQQTLHALLRRWLLRRHDRHRVPSPP